LPRLLGGEHGKAERLCGAGHAGVVGDDPAELVRILECGRQVQSIEPSRVTGSSCAAVARTISVISTTETCATTACACASNCGTRRRTARMTSTSMMALGYARLGFLDDELEQRRGVDVDQSCSSRIS
jgi:hypothetical protein